MLSLVQDIWFHCTSYMSRLIWADINFTIDNKWKYQRFMHVLLYKLLTQGHDINPSAWSDGHCPHAARSHSFVYISTS